MKQLLLRIQTGHDLTLYPKDFRKVVAGLDQRAPALFGRDDRGQTVDHPAARFIGGPGWVGVLVDEVDSSLLMRHAGEIILAASQHAGRPLPVAFEEHTCSITRAPFVHHYRASNVALKMRHPGAREMDFTTLIAKRIAGALVIQATHRGMDAPEEHEFEIACVDVDQRLGMQLKTDRGDTGEWVTVVPSVSFTSFVDLKGFWFVGNLSARGHGRVVAVRPDARAAQASQSAENGAERAESAELSA